VAGPATNGTVLNCAAASLALAGCLARFFFEPDFFAGAFAGALSTALVEVTEADDGLSIGPAGGALVTCCASRLVESIIPKTNQQFIFITQQSRD
jgi:hypothetical protein